MTTGQEGSQQNLPDTPPASDKRPSTQHLSGPLDAIHAYSTTHDEHLPDSLPSDPFPLFKDWLDHARHNRVQPNPNAMALATANDRCEPNVRIVLCRGVDLKEGSIWFFTNSHSTKGHEMAANQHVAASFHWDALDRQARVRGIVAPLPAAESDAYFASRTWEKRIGAWASNQSQPVGSREALLDNLLHTLSRFGIDPKNPPSSDANLDIPRPPHWGGYRIVASEVELWVGSPARMHDRARWTRPDPKARWQYTRLQP